MNDILHMPCFFCISCVLYLFLCSTPSHSSPSPITLTNTVTKINKVPLSLVTLDNGVSRWTGQIVSSNQAFSIDFTCDSDPSFCETARTIFQKAADRISGILRFVTPIKMNLAMFLPCNQQNPSSSCSETRILGYASPANFISLSNLNTSVTLSYPQALAKQLTDLSSVKLSTYDIGARFNALSNWWMGDGQISADQFDLEYVSVHEFLHGLGFGVGFWLGDPTDNTLIPEPDIDDSKKTFFGWKPASIWDKYIWDVSNNVAWLDYYNIFKNLTDSFTNGGKPTDKQLVSNFLQSNSGISEVASKIYDLATTNQTLVFRAHDRSVDLFIETSIKNFSSGSSLGHINFKYYYTKDFLMVYATKARSSDRVNLDSKIRETGSGPSGIGEDIILVLETLGYNTDKYTAPKLPLRAVSSDIDSSTPASAGSKSGGNTMNAGTMYVWGWMMLMSVTLFEWMNE